MSTKRPSGGESDAAGVEGCERDLETLAFEVNDVLARNAHVLEADHPIVERLEPHEVAPSFRLHPFGLGVDNKGADFFRFRITGHDDEKFGQSPIRTPELLSVDDIGVPFGSQRSGRLQRRRVRPNLRLG